MNIPRDHGFTLSDTPTEELRAELERRGAIQPTRIQQLPKPDYAELIKTCEAYIDEIMTGNSEDSDSRHYIYEAAIVAIYGHDFWPWHRKFCP